LFSKSLVITEKLFYKPLMSKKQLFHLQYLTTEYYKRMQKNPHYSLRSFARDLDVPASWLSEFLNSKKGMSLENAKKICQALSLSPADASMFTLSVRAHHSRSPQDRKTARAEIKAYKIVDAFKMKPADFVETGAWYHQTILELTEVEDFEHTEADIARRLRLPLPTIKRAVQSLQSAGVLVLENGKMKASFPETQSPMDTPSYAMRKYQEQILEKGATALHEQPLDAREFISVTFAFDAERVKAAKEALRKLHKQFTDEFYVESDSKNSVYQLSLQFFRMDQKG
jgi:uncharacterized protein (TIGR02147 family)